MTMQRLWPHFAQLGDGFAGGFSADLYDPVWLRCIDLVVSELEGLAGSGDLEEIASTSIIAAEQPWAERIFGTNAASLQLAYPGIIVWPFQQEVHNAGEGPNDRDEIVYPVAISFVEKGADVTGDDAMLVDRTAHRRHMIWREKVSRKFRKGTWPTITEIRESDVRYQLYAIPELYKSPGLFHGAIIVDFKAWEARD